MPMEPPTLPAHVKDGMHHGHIARWYPKPTKPKGKYSRRGGRNKARGYGFILPENEELQDFLRSEGSKNGWIWVQECNIENLELVTKPNKTTFDNPQRVEFRVGPKSCTCALEQWISKKENMEATDDEIAIQAAKLLKEKCPKCENTGKVKGFEAKSVRVLTDPTPQPLEN